MTQHKDRRGYLGLPFKEAIRRIYQQIWTLRGAVLQNKLSEGNIKLSGSRRGKGFFSIDRVRCSGLGQPWEKSKGISCQSPLEAVMVLCLGPMSLWADQKRYMGLESMYCPCRGPPQHLCLSVGSQLPIIQFQGFSASSLCQHPTHMLVPPSYT